MTMHTKPVDVTVRAWLEDENIRVEGQATRQDRARYNGWAHKRLQGSQREAKGMTTEAFGEIVAAEQEDMQ